MELWRGPIQQQRKLREFELSQASDFLVLSAAERKRQRELAAWRAFGGGWRIVVPGAGPLLEQSRRFSELYFRHFLTGSARRGFHQRVCRRIDNESDERGEFIRGVDRANQRCCHQHGAPFRS